MLLGSLASWRFKRLAPRPPPPPIKVSPAPNRTARTTPPRVPQARALLLALAPTLPATAAETPTIAKIEARLFYDRTGTLSPDVLADPTLLPGNMPITDTPSSATLVVVRLAGPVEQSTYAYTLHLVARLPPVDRWGHRLDQASRRRPTVLDTTARPGRFAPDGTTFVAFWLKDTGCWPIELTVTLRHDRHDGPPTRATIPFLCYE